MVSPCDKLKKNRSLLGLARVISVVIGAASVVTACVVDGTGYPGPNYPAYPEPQEQQNSGFSLRSAHGLCLDLAGETATREGGKIQVWQCQPGNPNQTWYFENGAIVNERGGCLDVDGHKARTNGGRVQIWSCQNNNPNQMWYFQGDSLINEHGLCLDVDGKSAKTNGGIVQVWQCQNANPNQIWYRG